MEKVDSCYCLDSPGGRSEVIPLVLQDFCRLSLAPSLKEGLFDVSQAEGPPQHPTVIFTDLEQNKKIRAIWRVFPEAKSIPLTELYDAQRPFHGSYAFYYSIHLAVLIAQVLMVAS